MIKIVVIKFVPVKKRTCCYYRVSGNRYGVEDLANIKFKQGNVYSSYSDNSILMKVFLYRIVAIIHTQRLHLYPPSNGLFQLYCCICAFWIPFVFYVYYSYYLCPFPSFLLVCALRIPLITYSGIA